VFYGEVNSQIVALRKAQVRWRGENMHSRASEFFEKTEGFGRLGSVINYYY
jgi:hypothetical protein